MVAAAIANHGTLMRPYLVQQVQAPDLTTIQNASPSVLSPAGHRRRWRTTSRR